MTYISQGRDWRAKPIKEPTHEEIAVAAYYLWQRMDCPDGNSIVNPVLLNSSAPGPRMADYIWSLAETFLSERQQ